MRAPPEAETTISGSRSSCGFFDGARNHLADHRAHGAADERVLHRAHDDRLAIELAASVDDRIVEPGVALRRLQAVGVGLQIGELQRIGGDNVAVFGFVLSVVEQVGEPGARVNAEMAVTFGADVEVLVEVLLPDDLAALVALDPEALGLDALFARSVELDGFPLEPCHRSDVSV